jgi:hypothetical protein
VDAVSIVTQLAKVLQEHPWLAPRIATQWSHVVLTDPQSLTVAEWKLFSTLFKDHRHVVGIHRPALARVSFVYP